MRRLRGSISFTPLRKKKPYTLTNDSFCARYTQANCQLSTRNVVTACDAQWIRSTIAQKAIFSQLSADLRAGAAE